MSCNGTATHAIDTRDSTHRLLNENEIVLPPEFSAVCGYHLALFVRWQRQKPESRNYI
jgi:hypothetical protein